MSELPIQQGGLRVLSGIVPASSASTYGTHYSYLGVGGYVEVPNIDYRNSIPPDSNMNDEGYSTGRRRYGMMVYVIDEDKLYRLFPFSGGSVVSMETFTGTSELNQVTMLSNNNGWIEVPDLSVLITGGTYFSGNSSIVLYDSTGGTVSITGITTTDIINPGDGRVLVSTGNSENIFVAQSNMVFNGTNLNITGGTFITDSGGSLHSSAIIQFKSTTKGVLLPGMTTSQKNAIVNPTTGLTVYDSTIEDISVYTSSGWTGVIAERDNLQKVTERGNSTNSGLIISGTTYLVGSGSTTGNTFVTSNSANTQTFTIKDNGNILIGTTTDAGYKLDVNGTSRFQSSVTNTSGGFIANLGSPTSDAFYTLVSGPIGFYTSHQYTKSQKLNLTNATGLPSAPNNVLAVSGSITVSSALAAGVSFNNTLVAAANNDVLVGLDINPTFTNGAFTGVMNLGLRSQGTVLIEKDYGLGSNSLTSLLTLTKTSASAQYISLGYYTRGTTGVDSVGISIGTSYMMYLAGSTIIGGYQSSGLFTFGQSPAGANFVTGTNILANGITIGGGTVTTISTATASSAIYSGAISSASSGDLVLQARTSATNKAIYFVTGGATATTAMIVFASTNVAIGTTTDAGYKLDVNGSTRIVGSGSTTGNTFVTSNSANTQTFTIKDNGNVLIGTTTDGGEKLYVNGNTSVNGNLQILNNGGLTFYNGGSIFSSHYITTSNELLTANSNNTHGAWKFNNYYVSIAKNLAVGTTLTDFVAPSQTFLVLGSSVFSGSVISSGVTRLSGQTSIIGSGTTSGSTAFSVQNSTGGTLLNLFNNGNLNVDNGSLYVDGDNGRVGIGITSPTYKLQVGDFAINSSNKIVIATANSGVNGFYVYAGASNYVRTAIEHDYGTSLTRFMGSYNTGTNIIGQDGNNGHTILYSGPSSSERVRVVGSNGNVLIGTTTDAGYKLDVSGTTRVVSTGSTSGSTTLTLQNSTGRTTTEFRSDGVIGISSASTFTTQVTSVISASTTNSGIAIVPNGTGAFTLSIPDGTATGGNARGNYAVDLQLVRSNANHVSSGAGSFSSGGENRATGTYSTAMGNVSVASGNYSLAIGLTATSSGVNSISLGNANTASSNYSTVSGGQSNVASTGTHATVIGGQSNTASGQYSIAGGYVSTASALGAVALGGGATATAPYSLATGINTFAKADFSQSFGLWTEAYLYGQTARSSGRFTGQSDAQNSIVTARRLASLTSGGTITLSLDGTGTTNLIIPSDTNRLWNVVVNTITVCTVVSGGTLTVGDAHAGEYKFLFKRVGGTSTISPITTSSEVADTSMATASFSFSAGTSQQMAITFNAPNTANNSTFRAVAKVALTEVAW